MPAQPGGGLDGVDEEDAVEVDVLRGEFREDVIVVDTFGA